MRAALLLLLAFPAAAQTAPPADRWRAEASAALAGAGDPGVRVERRVWGPAAVGLGRTETGAPVVYAAAERPAGPVAVRASAGLTTVDGAVAPMLGAGLDVFPVPAVGAGVSVDRSLASGAATVVRLGLRVRPDRVDPGGTRPLVTDGAVAPHWRAAVGAAVGVDGATVVRSLSLERTVRGPVSAGVRFATYAGGGVVEDGGSRGGGAAEAFAAARSARRRVGLRAAAGVGLSVLDRGSSPLVPPVRVRREVRPVLAGGLGLDVYPAPGVGVGVEGRLVVAPDGAELSEVGVGLRVRVR